MLLQETGRYCHYDFTGPFFFVQHFRVLKKRPKDAQPYHEMMRSWGLGGLPSTSVWGYVESHKHCLPLSLPLLSSFVSFFLIIIEQPPDGGCKRYHFLIALPRAMRRSSCSLGRDFMISINSAAFVGFVDSISKKSFGVIPK